MSNHDYQCGRYMAQVYSHDISRMLKAIYFAYVEPVKVVPSFVLGVVDEVSTWKDLGTEANHWLEQIKNG